MTTLPFIDEHATEIDASPDRVWAAIVSTVRRIPPRLPGWVTAAWGLDPARGTGDWNEAVTIGDSVPGFTAAAIDPGHTLALQGRHRFASYELRFELKPGCAGRTRLSAQTRAAFPGLAGRVYRAMVIGTGGHRIAVRRILGRIRLTAERADRQTRGDGQRSEAQGGGVSGAPSG